MKQHQNADYVAKAAAHRQEKLHKNLTCVVYYNKTL